MFRLGFDQMLDVLKNFKVLQNGFIATQIVNGSNVGCIYKVHTTSEWIYRNTNEL